MNPEIGEIDQIIEKYHDNGEEILIQVLEDTQQRLGWLPLEALKLISERLEIPLSRIYRIISFQKAMSLVPKGHHVIQVCRGPACCVRGSSHLLKRMIKVLNIRPGETSLDNKFTLRTTNCVGCCALGPVVAFSDKYYSDPSTKEIGHIIAARS